MIERSLKDISIKLDSPISDNNKEDIMIKGVSTDTRDIKENNLYIPLIGDNFDGRDFIKEAEDKKASAFIIDYGYEVPNDVTIPYIRVKDTEEALRELSRKYREDLDMMVIAITGSNGKTTTKELLSSVLSEKYTVEKTSGNLNNQIGVPKTVLDLSEDTDIAIIELGTDNFGDIKLTTKIAKPDIAIITNIGDSHLHNLKSKKGIARAKMEIIEGLNPDGIFIYNGDDPTLKEVIKEFDFPQKIMTFGKDDMNDFKIDSIKMAKNGVSFKHGNDEFIIPLLGDHQAYNGALTVFVSEILDLSKKEIEEGLSKVKNPENRAELLKFDDFDVLNDSYKSNPESLMAGLDTFYKLNDYSKKIAVLGDMLELGDDEEKIHYRLGANIDPKNVDYVFLYGDLSKNMYEGALNNFPKSNIFHFDDKGKLFDKLKTFISPNTLIFVKGSHGMHMEDIIKPLKDINIKENK